MDSMDRTILSAGRRRRSPAKHPRSVALRDVALAAGVSTASVSRALNTPDAVTPEVRARVERAAATLGYAPHPAARALASRRSRTIGAIVPTIANSIFSAGIEAIEKRLDEARYALVLATSGYDPRRELQQARTLIDRGVDGLILVGRVHHPALTELLAERGVPYVCQGAYAADGPHPCVGFENRTAFALTVAHLLALGHRRFAMLAGIAADNDRVADRIDGARTALAAAGLDFVSGGLIECRYDVATARDATRRVLALEPRPTAIVCVNDVLAMGVLFECSASGIEVPESVSVTGFDDVDVAANLDPPLTTVHVPVDAMGRGAAEYLLNLLSGHERSASIRIPVRLVVRRSTAPPPLAGPPA